MIDQIEFEFKSDALKSRWNSLFSIVRPKLESNQEFMDYLKLALEGKEKISFILDDTPDEGAFEINISEGEATSKSSDILLSLDDFVDAISLFADNKPKPSSFENVELYKKALLDYEYSFAKSHNTIMYSLLCKETYDFLPEETKPQASFEEVLARSRVFESFENFKKDYLEENPDFESNANSEFDAALAGDLGKIALS